MKGYYSYWLKGADLAGQMHRQTLLIDMLSMSPSIMGGDDGKSLLSGPGAATMDSLRQRKLVNVTQLGEDVRLDLVL